MALHALCLCDGFGGFELAFRQLRASHGLDVRAVGRCERDAHAAAVLVARMEEARLDPAPVWDDLTTFDGRPWRDKVDLVTAGFPCQPFSAAGRKKGVADDRWLWPAIAEIVADVGPRFVFLENVRQLVPHGLPQVLADLADFGFDAEWGLLRASDVGAPHRRDRFWLLAHRHDGRRATVPREHLDQRTWDHLDAGGRSHLLEALGYSDSERRREDPGSASGDEGSDGRGSQGDHVAQRASTGLGDAERTRLATWGTAEPGGLFAAAGASGELADPESVGSLAPFGSSAWPEGGQPGVDHFSEGMADASGFPGGEPEYALSADTRSDRADQARRDIGWSSPFPPARDDLFGWITYLLEGGPEPTVRRGPDGRPEELVERLHLLGNGLVPAAAAAAFVELARRLGFTDLSTL